METLSNLDTSLLLAGMGVFLAGLGVLLRGLSNFLITLTPTPKRNLFGKKK